MLKAADYLKLVKSIFQQNGDPKRAQGQMRYMRFQFEYYGLKAPEWMAIGKDIMAKEGLYDGEDLKDFVRLCYADEYREVNYFGLEMMQRQLKKQPKEFIEFLEEALTTKSWWDTVDWLSKFVGKHFRRFPELTKPVTEQWMASGNIWLQRICLIFQLSYKDKTDFSLMCEYILRLGDSKEFFIQKGAGWALRQHSRIDPEGVVAFVNNNPQLSGLTKREALKWLNNQKGKS